MRQISIYRWILTGAVIVTAGMSSIWAEAIEIQNPGFEEPDMLDPANTSFDGTFGIRGGVPGWASNEKNLGGALRVDAQYPGRSGNNVLYLHGSGEQNFYTAEYALPEDLQSDTTYVLSFDVLRWQGITQDDAVQFRAGVYTGVDYESRVPLKEFQGELLLVDRNNNPANKVTITLVFTTGKVEPGTKFWIGGDSLGNALDPHRAHFDNFSLQTATK